MAKSKSSQSSFKNPRVPRIWSSAVIPRSYKDYLREKFIEIGQEKQRRPNKRDFTISEYHSLFWYFGSLKQLLEDTGLSHWPMLRPWRKKDPEYIKERERNYERLWRQKNREKLRRYSLKKYYELKKRNPELLKKYGRDAWLRKKNNKIKCPKCENKILKDSSLCRHCALIKRWDENNGVRGRRPYWKKCIDCYQKCVYKSKRCFSCASKKRWKDGIFDNSKIGWNFKRNYMKEIKIKTIYNGLATIRDYQLDRENGIILNYGGAKMTILPQDIDKYLVDAPMDKKTYISKFDGKKYKLIYFKFIPD